MEILYSLIPRAYMKQQIKKIIQIKERLKVPCSRHKSYTNIRHKPLELKVRDRVQLQVAPWKGAIIFGRQGKPNSRYIEPFKILARVGLVAYNLKLPQELIKVQDTFHVCNLKKCLYDENLVIQIDDIQVNIKVHFMVEPVVIMDG